jgi:hypothetical protein
MSGDLIDQIASRFGREALDLNGDFYKKGRATTNLPLGSDDEQEMYQVNFSSVLSNDSLFKASWREYQVKNMGSQDLYPCPLCYVCAHHRLFAPETEEREIDETPIQIPQEFSCDPMSVLGSLDSEQFEIAASFCFKKITDVKSHIRAEHHCDTARIDSAVFYRYKVNNTRLRQSA